MINTIHRLRFIVETAWEIIPSWKWWRYAALRLGSFIMVYALTVSIIVIGFTAAGIALSVGAVLAIIPLAVFLAIRISGVLAGKDNQWRR